MATAAACSRFARANASLSHARLALLRALYSSGLSRLLSAPTVCRVMNRTPPRRQRAFSGNLGFGLFVVLLVADKGELQASRRRGATGEQCSDED
jgi:hypothetical protein